MRPESVTVVVPTYNEAENLPLLAPLILGHGYNLLVVDDNSPDGTGAVGDELALTHSQVAVLHRESKQGLGPAYVGGFDAALARGSEVVVEMDCDFSHDPEDLPRLVGRVDAGADVVIGSRYVPGGSVPDWPLARRAISKGGNYYARRMLDLPIADATGGFRAYRSSALRLLDYSSTAASGYAFQVEMAWRAHRAGLEVVEVPITFRDRQRGDSKMGMGIVAEAMILVTRWGLERMLGRSGR